MARVPRPALTDALARFQAELVRLALRAVATIVNAELVRRESIPLVRPAGRPRLRRPGEPPVKRVRRRRPRA